MRAAVIVEGDPDADGAGRVPKSDIEIAPVHHRLPDRIRAHALICFLALDLLTRIQQHTAHIGKRSFHGLSRTTPEQLDLFDALSLPKPA